MRHRPQPRANAQPLATLALAAVLGLAVCLVSPDAAAQCNLQDCATVCNGGCGVSFPILHAGIGLSPAAGKFQLQGTRYEDTCLFGVGCTIDLPPLRFWAHDHYLQANSGRQDPVVSEWLANAPLDFSLGMAPGDWILYQSNWAAPSASFTTIDGCPTSILPFPPTVAELSWTDDFSFEGTVDHDSWYLIAAVPGTPFDFDYILGGDGSIPPGDGPASVRIQSVPDVIGLQVRDPRTGSPVVLRCPDHGAPAVGTANPIDSDYFDVELLGLSTTNPDFFTEVGRNFGTPLIGGLQLLYASARTGPPTSSDPAIAGWQPVRDPSAPATDVAGVIPYGAIDNAVVALPRDGGPHYLAARIVYHDQSLNAQLGPGPADLAPRLVSLTGAHCGPVDAPASIPVCNAGPGYQTECDGGIGTVTVDGSGSFDPEGQPLTFLWSGSGVTYDDPDAAITAATMAGPGITTVTLTVEAGGRVASCTAAVFVNDCTQPDIDCPPSPAVACTGASEGCAAGFVATASDGCAAMVAITNSATGGGGDASGCYPLGTTAVTFTATDPAGHERTCAATVTVVDGDPPIVTCPAPQQVPADAACMASPPIVATAVDPCIGPVPVYVHPVSPFPLGTTEIEATAIDTAGNSGRCTTTVEVIDLTPPTANCALAPAPPLPPLSAGSPATARSDLFLVVAQGSDNCDPTLTATATLNGIPVSNGQLVVLRTRNKPDLDLELPPLGAPWGPFAVFIAPAFILEATLTDAAGNATTCRFELLPPP